MNILVVEDDSKTAQAICRGLVGEGYQVVTAVPASDGAFTVDPEALDLVLLDWMLPGRDGIDILKSLRAKSARLPVLMLTARDTIEDRVLGLDSGADDYLAKPFAFAELLARVRVLLRRSGLAEPLRRRVQDLLIDLASRRVWRGGEEVLLTPREFDLLAFLARHEGQVVTRQMLAHEVWREINRATPLDNVIDVHLTHLRGKVDGGRKARLIQTVRGVGIVLRAEAPP